MKSITYFLLLAATVTSISCSKDDNEPEFNTAMLLGEWQLEEMNYSGTSSVTRGGETSTVSYAAEAIDIDVQVSFNDHTNYTTAGSYTIRMATTTEGETHVEDFPYSNLTGSGTYRIDGNKIFTSPITGDAAEEGLIDSGEATILELTENRLVFFSSQEETTTVDNLVVEINIEYLQVFIR